MNNLIGIYDIFCSLTEEEPGFAWDEVWILCDNCLSNVTSEHKVLGKTDGECNGCF